MMCGSKGLSFDHSITHQNDKRIKNFVYNTIQEGLPAIIDILWRFKVFLKQKFNRSLTQNVGLAFLCDDS